MAERVYIDACVFIELVQRKDPQRLDACDDLLAKAKHGDLIFVASVLAITEVNRLTPDPAFSESDIRKIQEFFEHEFIATRQVDRQTAELAQRLIAEHQIGTIDAVHVATAIIAKCSTFYTYDGLKRKKGGMLKFNEVFGTPPMRIMVPPDPDRGTLFATKPPAADDVIIPTESELAIGPDGHAVDGRAHDLNGSGSPNSVAVQKPAEEIVANGEQETSGGEIIAAS